MLFFLIRNKEFSSQCKWFGAIGTVVVLLSGVLPLFCGVGVRPGFLCTETARGPRRATEKPRLRRIDATGGGIKCFQQRRTAVSISYRCFKLPLFQATAVSIHCCFNPGLLFQFTTAPIHCDLRSQIAGRQVPKCKHSESQWSSWSSGLPPC